MTERGILFTPENYDKTARSEKTHTRRLTGLDEVNESPNDWSVLRHSNDDPQWVFAPLTKKIIKGPGILLGIKCPFGTVGDRLYVKEGLEKCWRVRRHINFYGLRYRRDSRYVNGQELWRWQRDTLSPLHMPKWAARLWLEITEVRVERLQDISQADAIAEGAPPSHPSIDSISRDFGYPDFSRSWFAQLWQSIHGPGSWERNLFVWVISFRKVER